MVAAVSRAKSHNQERFQLFLALAPYPQSRARSGPAVDTKAGWFR